MPRLFQEIPAVSGNPQNVLMAFGLALVTLAAIVILVVAVFWIRSRWFDNTDSTASPEELLLGYRELLRRGELTDEEYRWIKGRFAPRTGGKTLSDSEPGLREAGPLHESAETTPSS